MQEYFVMWYPIPIVPGLLHSAQGRVLSLYPFSIGGIVVTQPYIGGFQLRAIKNTLVDLVSRPLRSGQSGLLQGIASRHWSRTFHVNDMRYVWTNFALTFTTNFVLSLMLTSM